MNQQGCVKNLLEGRKTAVIGTWNVRKNLKLTFLVYLRHTAIKNIIENVIISSSRKDDIHRKGVAIVFKNKNLLTD